MRALKERVVRRWMVACLGPAFFRWHTVSQEKQRLAGSAEKVVLRWQNISISFAFSKWDAHTKSKIRLRHVAMKIVHRWQHMALTPAFSRWIEYSSEISRLRRIASRAVLKMRQVLLSRAWLSWGNKRFQRVKHKTILTAVARKWFWRSTRYANLDCFLSSLMHMYVITCTMQNTCTMFTREEKYRDHSCMTHKFLVWCETCSILI